MKEVSVSVALLLVVAGSLGANAQVSETNSFTNLNKAIPDGNASGLHDVRAITSAIAHLSSVRLKLRVTGEFNGDLYGYVRHIRGGATNFCVLLNRVGRTATRTAGYADAGLDVVFDDAAVAGDIHRYQTNTIPPAGTPLTGAWQPDGRRVDPEVVLDTTARTATLSSFTNADGSGEWTLYLADLEAGGTNMLVNWELQLTGIATPVVTWPTPGDIVYGTALGPAQLNATSSVPGTVTYSPPAGTVLNAGSNLALSVTFKPTDTNSYASVTTNVSINVLKATLGVTALNTNKVYGSTRTFAGTEFSLSGTLFNGNTLTNVSLSSTGAPASAVVGGYAIVPSAAQGSGLTNYTISYTNGTLTVGAATLGVMALNTNKVYGSTRTFAGTEFSLSGTLFNGNTLTNVSLSSTGAPASAAVGGYAIVASSAQGSGLTNYTINYTNGTLTVGAATLGVTALNTNKVYGSTRTFAGTEFSLSGTLFNGNTLTNVSLSSTGAPASAAVGGYAIVASSAQGSGLTNYTINYTNGTLTVGAATLGVTARDTNKVYGSTRTFAGTEFNLSGTLFNGNTLTNVSLSSTGAPASAAVGGYAIVASSAQGSGLTNYTISYTNGVLTVGAATLGVTARDTNKVYGSTRTFAGTEFNLSGTLFNGNTLTNVSLSSTGAPASAAVGGYAIVASSAQGSGLTNYTISYTNGVLTVGAATLGVTARDTNKVYGSTRTFAGTEFNLSGTLFNGNTLTNVSLSSTGAPASAAVGGYAIVPSAAQGSGLTNYTILYTNGMLTVGAASLGVTARDTNKVYGSTQGFAGTEFNLSGTLFNGNTLTNVSLSSTGAPASAAVGGYAIVPSAAQGSGLTNYTILYTNGMLTVGAASLGVTARDTNKVYGSTQGFAGTEFNLSGTLFNGNTLTNVSLSSTGAPASAAVGSYAIVPSAAQGSGLTNYTISYTNGVLTVGAASLGVTARDTNKVYGSTQGFAGTEFNLSGTLFNGNTLTNVSLSSTGAPASAAVGGYAIVPSAAQGSGLTNYTILYTNGMLTVGAASLGVTARDTNKVYGSTQGFAGTEFNLSGTLFNGNTLTNVSLSSTGAPASAAVGSYAIVPSAAQGSGLTNYTISYTNGTLTVSRAGTIGTLTSSPNPSPAGQPVAFTFTLSAVAPGAGTPTGTALFRIDGTNAGGPVSLSGGVAGYSTTNLAHGTNTVVAEYAGDGNFTGTTNLLSPVQLINTPPVAGPCTVERDPTNGVKVSIGTLLTNCWDGDNGDSISFLGVSATSTNGGTVVSNGGWVFYTPAPGFTNSDTFTYTISDGWGAPVSGLVTVIVRTNTGPSPNLTIIDLGGGVFSILGDGIPDRTYCIQFSDEPQSTNWQTLGAAPADPYGIFQFNDTNGSPQRFYRSVYP